MDRRYLAKINAVVDQKTHALLTGEIDQLNLYSCVDEALKDTDLTKEEIKKIAEEYVDMVEAQSGPLN